MENQPQVTGPQPVVVGNQPTKKARFKIPKPNRKVLIGLGIVLSLIVMAVAGGLLWKANEAAKPAFVIDDKAYSKTEYKEMMDLAQSHGVPEEEARNKYIEVEKKRMTAESLGIKPTDYQMYRATRNIDNTKKPAELDKWQQELTYEVALVPATEAAKKGGYSGAIFYFPFSRLMEPVSGAYNGKLPEGHRDPVKIEEDRQYAKAKVEEYHKKIKDGYSVADAMAEIQKDKRLVFTGSGNPTKTFQVSVIDGVAVQQDTASASQKLHHIDATKLRENSSVGTTDILTGQLVILDLPGQPNQDAFYYFYKIDSYHSPDAEIDKKFDDKLKSLKVTVNVS